MFLPGFEFYSLLNELKIFYLVYCCFFLNVISPHSEIAETSA